MVDTTVSMTFFKAKTFKPTLCLLVYDTMKNNIFIILIINCFHEPHVESCIHNFYFQMRYVPITYITRTLWPVIKVKINFNSD